MTCSWRLWVWALDDAACLYLNQSISDRHCPTLHICRRSLYSSKARTQGSNYTVTFWGSLFSLCTFQITCTHLSRTTAWVSVENNGFVAAVLTTTCQNRSVTLVGGYCFCLLPNFKISEVQHGHSKSIGNAFISVAKCLDTALVYITHYT